MNALPRPWSADRAAADACLLWASGPPWVPSRPHGTGTPQELVSLLPQEPTWPQCPGQERKGWASSG